MFADILVIEPMAQETPGKILALFALTLIPYSMINPFVGVFVDRWARRSLLLTTNALRGALLIALPLTLGRSSEVAFYAALLIVLGLGRLCLTTKGALLPVVVGSGDLIAANSLSAGGGMVAALAGAAVGIGSIAFVGPAAAFVLGGVLYFSAAAVATRLSHPYAHPYGPTERVLEAIRLVARDVGQGIRSVLSRPRARVVLEAIALLRTTTMFVAVAAILAIKAGSETSGGRLSSSAFALGAAGAGAFVGAVASPWLGRRIGAGGLVMLGFAVSGGTMLALGGLPGLPAIVILTGATGFGTLVAKIAVDSTLQAALEDEVRGRGFALYDTVYNMASVAAAALMVGLEPFGLRPAVLIVGAATVASGALLARRIRTALASAPP